MSQMGTVLDAAELSYDSDTGKLLEVRADWTTRPAMDARSGT
jgi:hypothetical protein